MASIYHEILKNVFPKGYCLAFAYGSGVYKQLGQRSVQNKMIDFILAVEDTEDWHRKNMAMNSNHYSMLKIGGPEYVAHVQDKFGAKIYFNTLVPTYKGIIKYGVISRKNLISDLMDWETLYVSGRLHKPVRILYKDEGDEDIQEALRINLFQSLHAALLLLPETFSERQLYTTIAGLSYSGDFRMLVAEDKNKVQNLMGGTGIDEFRALYQPILEETHEYVLVDKMKGMGEQDTSPQANFYHLSMLAKNLQNKLVRLWNRDGRHRDLEDVLRAAASDPDTDDYIEKGISSIVRKSSISQTAKGLFTAGIFKSAKYSLAKVRKLVNS